MVGMTVAEFFEKSRERLGLRLVSKNLHSRSRLVSSDINRPQLALTGFVQNFLWDRLQVFGETEIGGTSVIYISDIPLGFLSFNPELGEEPLPELTDAALSKVPPIVIGMSVLMTGLWWVIDRRAKLAKKQQESNVENTTSAVTEAAPPSETEEENSA